MGGTSANTDTETYREISSKTSFLVIAIVIAFIGLLLLARIFYVLRKNPKLSTHTLIRMLMAYFASLFVKSRCVCIVSISCSPTVSIGLSEVCGS